MNQKTLALLLVIVAVVAVAISGGLFYLYQEKENIIIPYDLKENLPPPIAVSEQAVNNDLMFVPDPGLRVKDASLPSPSIDKSGKVFLYYEDTSTLRRGKLVATSLDGLNFSDGIRQREWIHDPKTLVLPQPDKNGNPIYRRYFWDREGNMLSESSNNGIDFIQDQGIRYKLQPEDKGTVGITDFFVNSEGGIVLLYIGDMMGLNNIRRAYSPPGDNGMNFTFDRGNILGDASYGGGPRSYVDQKAIVLSDGRIRLFTMKSGSLFCFISTDDGKTFTLEPGVRLAPDDFKEFKVYSLHDPWAIQLPDGRYRIYVAARLTDMNGQMNMPPGDNDFAIVSAVTPAE